MARSIGAALQFCSRGDSEEQSEKCGWLDAWQSGFSRQRGAYSGESDAATAGEAVFLRPILVERPAWRIL